MAASAARFQSTPKKIRTPKIQSLVTKSVVEYNKDKTYAIKIIKKLDENVTGQGLEPRSLGPKPSVLPLDDPVKIAVNCCGE